MDLYPVNIHIIQR